MGQENRKDPTRRKVGKPTNVHSVNIPRYFDSVMCFCTNADLFKNKFNEFQIRIRDTKPMITGITEVKAKM
jgi:hypothetical protein